MLWGTEARGGEGQTAQSRGHGQHRLWGSRQPWSVWESDRPGGESRLLALVPGRPRASCPPLWNKMFTPVSASICGVWAVSQPVPCGGHSREQGRGASLFLSSGSGTSGQPRAWPGDVESLDRALLTASPLCFEYCFAASLGPSRLTSPSGPCPLPLSPARLLPGPCSALH